MKKINQPKEKKAININQTTTTYRRLKETNLRINLSKNKINTSKINKINFQAKIKTANDLNLIYFITKITYNEAHYSSLSSSYVLLFLTKLAINLKNSRGI